MHGLGRAIPDTCNGEKEKCEAGGGGGGGGGGGIMPKTFEQSFALFKVL